MPWNINERERKHQLQRGGVIVASSDFWLIIPSATRGKLVARLRDAGNNSAIAVTGERFIWTKRQLALNRAMDAGPWSLEILLQILVHFSLPS
jgi:hypothetical protein